MIFFLGFHPALCYDDNNRIKKSMKKALAPTRAIFQKDSCEFERQFLLASESVLPTESRLTVKAFMIKFKIDYTTKSVSFSSPRANIIKILHRPTSKGSEVGLFCCFCTKFHIENYTLFSVREWTGFRGSSWVNKTGLTEPIQ